MVGDELATVSGDRAPDSQDSSPWTSMYSPERLSVNWAAVRGGWCSSTFEATVISPAALTFFGVDLPVADQGPINGAAPGHRAAQRTRCH